MGKCGLISALSSISPTYLVPSQDLRRFGVSVGAISRSLRRIPQDPDDPDKLVLACGKNNNGKLFADTGIIFDESIGLYRVDPGFNSDEFREEIGITKSPKKETILISSTQVTDLVDGDVERPELVKRIMREFGCSQRSAYNAVDKAEAGRFILRRKGVTWKSVYYKALLN